MEHIQGCSFSWAAMPDMILLGPFIPQPAIFRLYMAIWPVLSSQYLDIITIYLPVVLDSLGKMGVFTVVVAIVVVVTGVVFTVVDVTVVVVIVLLSLWLLSQCLFSL